MSYKIITLFGAKKRRQAGRHNLHGRLERMGGDVVAYFKGLLLHSLEVQKSHKTPQSG